MWLASQTGERKLSLNVCGYDYHQCEKNYWSERSLHNPRSNLGRPLFLVLILEGVVVRFRNFEWAPDYQKYQVSNQKIFFKTPRKFPLMSMGG